MPAKGTVRVDPKNSYIRVENNGKPKENIFSSCIDQEVFMAYLSEYLSPPANPETIKTKFYINGKIYRGIPHQKKNYQGKVDLVSYDFTTNSFELVLLEIEKGTISKLLKSLLTRYSIYFNNKYNRKGQVFAGTYKAKPVVSSEADLPETTTFKTNDYIKVNISSNIPHIPEPSDKASPVFLENLNNSPPNRVQPNYE